MRLSHWFALEFGKVTLSEAPCPVRFGNDRNDVVRCPVRGTVTGWMNVCIHPDR